MGEDDGLPDVFNFLQKQLDHIQQQLSEIEDRAREREEAHRREREEDLRRDAARDSHNAAKFTEYCGRLSQIEKVINSLAPRVRLREEHDERQIGAHDEMRRIADVRLKWRLALVAVAASAVLGGVTFTANILADIYLASTMGGQP